MNHRFHIGPFYIGPFHISHRFKLHLLVALCAAMAAPFAAANSVDDAASAADRGVLKVGALATLEGPFAILGEEAMRGVAMALSEVDHRAGGHRIELLRASSDATRESALAAARQLVEEDGVRILLGPLSGSEGLALKDYAKTQPQTTFINGASAAQDTTLREPAANFFRFSTDGAQWMAGLGDYVVKEKGYKRIITIGEDYSFIYTLVFGFLTEFCAAGGEVLDRLWVPIGQQEYGSLIAAIPEDVDAVWVGLGGHDALSFLSQFQAAGRDVPLIGGSITVDQTILSQRDAAKQALIGTPSAGPISDNWDAPEWRAFVARYQAAFPPQERSASPSLFAAMYYIAARAMIEGLNAVDGDLSQGQAAFRAALSSMTLDAPTGRITLDQNRNGVANIFLSEVVEDETGALKNQLIRVTPAVNQTLGVDPEQFLAMGPVGRHVPACD